MDEEDITARLLDLLTKVKNILTFFFDNLVHLPIVVDDHGIVHLKYFSRQSEDTRDELYVGFRCT